MCQTFFEIFRFFYGLTRISGVKMMSHFTVSSSLRSQCVLCCKYRLNNDIIRAFSEKRYFCGMKLSKTQ